MSKPYPELVSAGVLVIHRCCWVSTDLVNLILWSPHEDIVLSCCVVVHGVRIPYTQHTDHAQVVVVWL